MRGVPMIFEKIIEIVTAVETTDLHNLESLDQTSQKQLIDTFQNRVHAKLEKILPNMNWRSPHKLTQERRDEVDIYGTFSSEDDKGAVIIEHDKWRADQIAKKFLLAVHSAKWYGIAGFRKNLLRGHQSRTVIFSIRLPFWSN
jgi:hypothetical protein